MGTVVDLAQFRESRHEQEVNTNCSDTLDLMQDMYSTAVVGSTEWFAASALLEVLDAIYNALPFDDLREYLHAEFHSTEPCTRISFASSHRDPTPELGYVEVLYYPGKDRIVPDHHQEIDPKAPDSVMDVLAHSIQKYHPPLARFLTPFLLMARELAYQGFLKYKLCETPGAVQLTLYNEGDGCLYQAEIVVGLKSFSEIALDFQ